MIFILTFIILLILILTGAYLFLDDLQSEGIIYPTLLISCAGGGAVTFALSDTDRAMLAGCVLVLTAAIIFAIFWFNRRSSKRRATREH